MNSFSRPSATSGLGGRQARNPLRHWLAMGAVVAIVIGGIVVVARDWHQIKEVLSHADWSYLLLALLFTAISYAAVSVNFALSIETFNRRLQRPHLLLVGFVSAAVNHLFGLAGVPAITVRLALVSGYGVPTDDVVATSLLLQYISTLVLVSLTPIGLVLFIGGHSGSGAQEVAASAGTFVLLFLLALATVFLLNRRARQATFRWLTKAGRMLLRQNVAPALQEFDATLARGTATLQSHPRTLAYMVLVSAVDWTASAVALGFCFYALGVSISPSLLVTGFFIGVIGGSLGGIGVEEGSMTGAFTLLGVPFEAALLAPVLNRVVYYFIPFGISLGFYWPLLRRARPTAAVPLR